MDADQAVSDNKSVDNGWTGSLDGASDLQNCNGTLSVGVELLTGRSCAVRECVPMEPPAESNRAMRENLS